MWFNCYSLLLRRQVWNVFPGSEYTVPKHPSISSATNSSLESQQCKSWNKGPQSRDCLMLKPRHSSPPRSKRGPARESRYQGSFIRCRKKSCACVSHTALFCGVQAPAFFRFRAPRFKHAFTLARMTAPRALCYTTMRTCFSADSK